MDVGLRARWHSFDPAAKLALAWRWWKYGAVVFLFLNLGLLVVMGGVGLLWMALNIIPWMLIDAWTVDRIGHVLSWIWLVCMPFGYAFGARHLPSPPDVEQLSA
jgi:hypothetical protein